MAISELTSSDATVETHRRESGDSSVKKDPPKRIPDIVIPTTGGPIRLEALKRRSRLPASYATLKGDFRPLRFSQDYDRFVRGPLEPIVNGSGPFELVLDGDIDCGRSWEMPVLIAHCLEWDGSTATKRLIWATGMVDADLDPLPSEYHIPTKIAACANLLQEFQRDGYDIKAVMPMPRNDAERAEIEEACAQYGMTCHFADTFQAVCDALGISPPTADADDGVSAGDGNAIAAAPEGSRRRPIGFVATASVGVTAAIVAVFVLLLSPNRSDPSTTTEERPSDIASAEQILRVPVETELAVYGLYAKDRATCIEKILNGEDLDANPATMTVDGFSLETGEQLCGLRFSNQSGEQLALSLGPALTGMAIRGSAALFNPSTMPPSGSAQLVFAKSPSVLNASMSISRNGETPRELGIRME